GDPKIDHLDIARDAYVDVVGCEIAVDDAQESTLLVHGPMRGVQAAAGVGEHLERDAQRDALRQLCRLLPQLRKGAALQKLHGDVALAALVSQFWDAYHVWEIDVCRDCRRA